MELDPETRRKNLALGWSLFGLFCAIFAATAIIALVYLWVD